MNINPYQASISHADCRACAVYGISILVGDSYDVGPGPTGPRSGYAIVSANNSVMLRYLQNSLLQRLLNSSS